MPCPIDQAFCALCDADNAADDLWRERGLLTEAESDEVHRLCTAAGKVISEAQRRLACRQQKEAS